jgi:hypothetical protein
MKCKESLENTLNILLSNTLENLDKMDKFLDECNQPVLNLKDVNNLNRSITSNEIEAITVSLHKESRT